MFDPVASSSIREQVLRPREELLVIRAGAWRFLVPSRHVERVLPAALPGAIPAAGGALCADLVPVVFAEALFGAKLARLAPDHKIVLLSEGRRRAFLWVDAVEDVVEHAPVEAPAWREELVAGWSGGERTLAVIDVSRLLDLAVGPAEEPSLPKSSQPGSAP